MSSQFHDHPKTMNDKYISIQKAAKVSGKSIQTIRRAVKSKRLDFKKRKTPQGFNYSINQESLCELFKFEIKEEIKSTSQEKSEKLEKIDKNNNEQTDNKTKNLKKDKTEKNIKNTEDLEEIDSEKMTIEVADFKSFAQAMERLVSQHAEERQSFLRLVNTLQEKIFVLENQVNLLQAPKKQWYQIWK